MFRMVAASTSLIRSLRSLASYPSGTGPPVQTPFSVEAAILPRIRSPVNSRSNCANDSSTLSISLARWIAAIIFRDSRNVYKPLISKQIIRQLEGFSVA